MKFNVILFDDFETMDAMGPVEVIGTLDKFMKKIYEIEFYSEKGGIVKSSQNVRVDTLPLKNIESPDILLIPGGFGVRKEVNNQSFVEQIENLSENAKFVLTVCTGSALLARTGLLKNLHATSNKMSFGWVSEQDSEVSWVRKERWVSDGKFYTSSGVSAGIDMTLGYISDTMGAEISKNIARGMEYIWNSEKENDPFC